MRAVVDDQVTILGFINNFHGFFIFCKTVVGFTNHSVDFEVSENRNSTNKAINKKSLTHNF